MDLPSGTDILATQTCWVRLLKADRDAPIRAGVA
jgi:hypothetical protein